MRIRWTFFWICHYFVLASVTARKSLVDHALSDNEYRFNMGDGYVFFEILKPEELSYTYKINPGAFSVPWNSSMNGVGLVPAEPPCGCGSLTNGEDVEGQVALLERGECSFVSKVVKAQEAGAIAAIVTDNDGRNDEIFISMVDDTTQRKVVIPAGFLLGKNGHVIRHTLHKLHLTKATINIPLNISTLPIHQLNQPPWLVW